MDSITVRLRDSLHEAVDHVVEHGGTVRISSAFGHPIGKGYSVEIEFPVTGTEAVAQAEAAIGHKDHARLDADAKLLRLQDRETNPQANPSAVLGPVRRGGRHV